ncbi:MAG TPA: carboxypeptidase-like regulatory domain-containing protein [Gemmatimonadaceae bacterium]|nr:carboxypeptidase-like regulatory domain-containing protein [Gemmatimonadaceae bacterium]
MTNPIGAAYEGRRNPLFRAADPEPRGLSPATSTVSIGGRVTDSASGKALIAANVLIPELNTSTNTDTAGRYELKFSPPSNGCG